MDESEKSKICPRFYSLRIQTIAKHSIYFHFKEVFAMACNVQCTSGRISRYVLLCVSSILSTIGYYQSAKIQPNCTYVFASKFSTNCSTFYKASHKHAYIKELLCVAMYIFSLLNIPFNTTDSRH